MSDSQVTVTVPAATAAAPTQAKTKGANKPTAKTAQKPAAPAGIRYAIKPAYRPGSGAALASYTIAWMTETGMFEGKPVPTSLIRKLGGDSMIRHHTKQGNIEPTKDGYVLTGAGMMHFAPGASANRNIRANPEYVQAYVDAFTQGKTSDLVKNADAFDKL